MSKSADGVVGFGEWLPDLPDLNNPGLTVAKNVIPADGVYKSFLPLAGTGDSLTDVPYGAHPAIDTSGNGYFYAFTQRYPYVRNGTGWSGRYASTYNTATDGSWSTRQFDEFVCATNYADPPIAITVGSASNFATLGSSGTAPYARTMGVVGRFLVLGDTNLSAATPNGIQWSAIDDPRNWPTPGSSTALSLQAGEQFLNANWGPVTNIVDGEQFGIVFQRQGITRMSYVGGSVVFQFDTIERARGAWFANSVVQVGRLAYFISGDGFYVTDGIDVKPIGDKKVDNWFADSVDTAYKHRVRGAVDYANRCIYWSYPSTSSNNDGRPDRIIVYNYAEGRWSWAETDTQFITTGVTAAITLDNLDSYFSSIDIATASLDSSQWAGGVNTILGFDATNALGAFSGEALDAILDGAEVELFPGRLARVQGVKPLVTGTSPTITVALGTRGSQGSSVTYTSARTPNSRTGFADFRKEARYHRARVSIDGLFSQAIGVEYQAVESGVA